MKKNLNRLRLLNLFFVLLIIGAGGILGLSFANATIGSQETPSYRPSFKKRKIEIGGRKILVEVADTNDRRNFGLMFVKSLKPDEGMLFVFDDEKQRAFWMANTLIPLSIGYFGRDKVLSEVLDMQPAIMGQTNPKTYPSRTKAMYALEMNVGWYERHKIRPGVSFRFADN